MVSCNFCGSNIERGTGKMFVKVDGRIINFCSSKCEKNMLGNNRKARETKWTKEYHNLKSNK